MNWRGSVSVCSLRTFDEVGNVICGFIRARFLPGLLGPGMEELT
jgi:hypothetical protein